MMSSRDDNNFNITGENIMLSDYDVEGTHVPSWVRNIADLVVDGEISKSDFAHLIRYLYDQHILSKLAQ